uniref:Uncharacterized protein n=1 Tax=Meloidogyne incognita TaxID=6306 RepID=A0A914NSV8_MELIC
MDCNKLMMTKTREAKKCGKDATATFKVLFRFASIFLFNFFAQNVIKYIRILRSTNGKAQLSHL